uniref:Anaphase-promoting complex subunit 2 n=1 Tax=Parastrongyloides trichosuri TaxID=131310 RepID=A0A0N4ZXA9_PARTI
MATVSIEDNCDSLLDSSYNIEEALFNYYVSYLFCSPPGMTTIEANIMLEGGNNELIASRLAAYLHSLVDEDPVGILERFIIFVDAMEYSVKEVLLLTSNDLDSKKNMWSVIRTISKSFPCYNALLTLLEKVIILSFYSRNQWKEEIDGEKKEIYKNIYYLTLSFCKIFCNKEKLRMEEDISKIVLNLADDLLRMSNSHKKLNLLKPNLLNQLSRKFGPIFSWISELKLQNENDIRIFFQNRAEHFLLKNISDTIFDSIIAYPETKNNIKTIGKIMEKYGVEGREMISKCITESVNRHLMHVGVSTDIILRVYASCVESIKILDNTCVMMHKICKIIKDYIKKRPDTVRSIVNYLINDSTSDWHSKTHQNSGIIVDEEDMAQVNDEFLPSIEENTIKNWKDWKPDPPDAPPGDSRFYKQSADLFNMLVSIYGSKELFVKEYRQLLAERLIEEKFPDIEAEKGYLELMKRRFTDGELQNCEVMLKDIEDSRIMDKKLKEKKNILFTTEVRIISRHFWPKIEHLTFEMPQTFKNAIETYKKTFEEFRASRTLIYYNTSGMAILNIELNGVKMDMTVTVPQASVLSIFLERDNCKISDMISIFQLPRNTIKKACEYWTSLGYLLPSDMNDDEGYSLVKTPINSEKVKKMLVNQDQDSDEEESNADDGTIIDSLEQYWNYTRNLIANSNDGIKPERLLQLYKMFNSPSKRGPSLDHVVMLLQRKVKQNILSVENGVYFVVKPNSA